MDQRFNRNQLPIDVMYDGDAPITNSLYERRFFGEFSTQNITASSITDGYSFIQLNKSAAKFFGSTIFPWRYIWFDAIAPAKIGIVGSDMQFSDVHNMVMHLKNLNSGNADGILIKAYTKHYKDTQINVYGLNYIRSILIGRKRYNDSGYRNINPETFNQANASYVKEVIKTICIQSGIYNALFDNATYPIIAECFWIKSRQKRIYNTRAIDINWAKSYTNRNYNNKIAFRDGFPQKIIGTSINIDEKIYSSPFIVNLPNNLKRPLNASDVYYNKAAYSNQEKNNKCFSKLLIRPIQFDLASTYTWIYFDCIPLGMDTFKLSNIDMEKMEYDFSLPFSPMVDIVATYNMKGRNTQRIQLVENNINLAVHNGSADNGIIFNKEQLLKAITSFVNVNSLKSQATYRFAIGNPNTGILSELSNGFNHYYDNKVRNELILPSKIFETKY